LVAAIARQVYQRVDLSLGDREIARPIHSELPVRIVLVDPPGNVRRSAEPAVVATLTRARE
jgi:hypothetical protein